MDDEKQAKDTELSNQSRWMLLIDQPELEERLLPVAGVKSVPITIKVSSFGADVELNRYTSYKVKDLLEEVAALSGGIESSRIKLKVVEDTQTRRIDTQLYLRETMTLPEAQRVLNTLQDVKLQHNSLLVVEEKSDEELAADVEDVVAD